MSWSNENKSFIKVDECEKREFLLNSHTSVNCLAAETVWSVEKFINFNPGLSSVFVSYHRTVLFYEPFTSGCLLAVSRLLKGTGVE